MSERTRVPQPVQLRSRSFDRWPSSSRSEGECEKGLHALAGVFRQSGPRATLCFLVQFGPLSESSTGEAPVGWAVSHARLLGKRPELQTQMDGRKVGGNGRLH